MNYRFDKTKNSLFLANKKIAIILAYFYEDIANNLLKASEKTLIQYGIKINNIDVFYTPGAFEVPLMAQKITPKYDGIIVLGAVIKGETPHFDFVAGQCASGISTLSLKSGIPIGFGILTTDNMTQTLARAGGNKGNKGKEATMAMIEMLYLIDK